MACFFSLSTTLWSSHPSHASLCSCFHTTLFLKLQKTSTELSDKLSCISSWNSACGMVTGPIKKADLHLSGIKGTAPSIVPTKKMSLFLTRAFFPSQLDPLGMANMAWFIPTMNRSSTSKMLNLFPLSSLGTKVTSSLTAQWTCLVHLGLFSLVLLLISLL